MKRTTRAVAVSIALALAGCNREASVWEAAAARDTVEAYEQYLSSYPEGEHAARAREGIGLARERDAWNAVRRSDSLGAYDAFLEEHPAGAHASRARERRALLEDELADWEKAETSDSRDSYTSFLEIHPIGRFASEAAARITALTLWEERLESRLEGLEEASLTRCVAHAVEADDLVVHCLGPADLGGTLVAPGLVIEMTIPRQGLLVLNPDSLVPQARVTLRGALRGKAGAYGLVRAKRIRALNGMLRQKDPRKGPYPEWVPVAIEARRGSGEPGKTAAGDAPRS